MPEINGYRLMSARKKRGLTQAELGQKAYISKQVISNIERGVTKTVSEPVINLLSHGLIVTVDYLMGKSSDPHKNQDGLIVPISILPEWDYDYEIKQLLKKHLKSRDIEVLLRDIIYYLSQLEDYNYFEKEKHLGVTLLRSIMNILKGQGIVDLELLVKIIGIFEEKTNK